jgi:nuclear pore complex protein Nup160
VVAATKTGSVYRLVLPIGRDGHAWSEPSGSNWCREYVINSFGWPINGLVQVQGPLCIAVGLPNGSLLRIETESLGDQNRDGKHMTMKVDKRKLADFSPDEWTEVVIQHGSFLSSLTAFLPNLHHSPSGGSEIVAMTSHPQPTDVAYTWTLSRDRTVRLWTAKAGCVSAKTLSSTSSGRGGTPVPATLPNGAKPQLLEAAYRTLLRTFSTDENLFLLVFIPTSSSPVSAGFFHVLETVDDQLYELGRIDCSTSSAHCHLQDYVVIGNNLYILWDRQGQSHIEKTMLNPEVPDRLSDTNWRSASHAPEPELTPAHLEELLSSPGSLTDKFYEAIMRPGVFSALTLRVAIEQYTDACLSLPGHSPSQLRAEYATVGENIAAVVGCTVGLIRDPHTGSVQYANYWNALKRDWEGFIARCREIERSARWPLALGAGGLDGDVFVIERERVASVVEEDLALRLRRLLDESAPLDPGYTLLDVVWMLRTKLGPQAMLSLEQRLFDICHQEIGFSMADIIQDQADQAKFIDDLDDGMQSWILGRLDSIPHLDREVRTILDVIGGLDKAVKQEEDEVADEVALHSPPPRSEFFRALTAAYVTATVNARYDLCLTLMLILFFLSLELQDWSPALLAEMFAVFRGIAMLRCAARRSAGDAPGAKPSDDSTAADDMIARMGSMQVSHPRNQSTSNFFLIHRLLATSGATLNFAAAAHHYLDNSGMLRSTTPADVTNYEIRFCNGLRELGYHEVAREMLAWLPRTPSSTYVCGRLWLDVGRVDDAAYLMEKLAARAGEP